MANPNPVRTPENQQKFRDAQFKPGQSGNPTGRPKGVSLEKLMYRQLNKFVDMEKLQLLFKNRVEEYALLVSMLPNKPRWKDVVAARRVIGAARRDESADVLINRTDGMPIQTEVQRQELTVRVLKPSFLTEGPRPSEIAEDCNLIDVQPEGQL